MCASRFSIIFNCELICVVEIRGKNGETFRGFYIQVRDQDGGPIGTFLSPDENEASAHNCFNMKNVSRDKPR